jgi:solute carrier family 45 protein 1/2/4
MISCLYIRERDPRLEALPKDEAGLGVVSFFRQITAAMFRLPPQIRKVCEVQFFNWIGWFPFLFYITTYIGQLKVNPIFEEYPDLSSDEINRQWEDATRVGSFALLVYAIISFIASIILPILIVPSYRPPGSNKPPEATSRLYRFLANFRIPHLTLRRAWLYSHILFAICMLCTFFVSTPVAGTVLVGIVGICWGLTMWAPFALIAAEISKRESRRRFRKAQQTRQANIDGAAGTVAEEVHDQAGVILGLHNVAVSAPQILATLISSGIFKLTQKDRGVAGDDSVGWVLRFGGLAALIAAFMTWRLGEERDEE